MFLFHRVTPAVLALLFAAGAWAVTANWLSPAGVALFTSVMLGMLSGQLVEWRVRDRDRRMLWAIPFLHAVFTFLLLLFLAQEHAQIFLGAISVLLFYLFEEHVFVYLHVHGSYQPFSLAYLTLSLNAMTMLFASSVFYGFLILLGFPLLVVTLAFGAFAWFTVSANLWAWKYEGHHVRAATFVLTLLLTQAFVIVSLFPTSIFVNAAFLTLTLHIFIGILRAHEAGQLTRVFARRYVLMACVGMFLLFVTARWF